MSQPSRFSSLRRTAHALLAAAVLGLSPLAAHAQARPLDSLRAQGVVGERYDGFAAVHGAASPDVTDLLARVNAERRTLYEQNAASQNAPAAAIGRVYAQEIMKSAPAKTWFLSESGQWAQK